MILLILDKVGFDLKVSLFFSNYLVGRKIFIEWFHFPFVQHKYGCRSRICSISDSISSFHYTYFLHLKKRVKNLKIPISFILFVDNRVFISQEKSLNKMNVNILCSYNIISFLLEQFSLIIKHGKTEFYHFSRLHGHFNPRLLDLNYIGGPILLPKDLWNIEYVFFLLFFIASYYNTIIKYYYITHLISSKKIQWRATLWILGIFCTSPTMGIETIADLIYIYLYLHKLSSRY